MNAPLQFGSYTMGRRVTPMLLCEEPGSEYASGPASSAPASTIIEPEAIADWKQAHAHIVALGRQRAAHERDLCRWLLAGERLGVHVRAGYANIREYAERTVGLNGRQTEERLRVGRALRTLPQLDRALAGGALCWSAVRELTRVATADTEQQWFAWAQDRRVREIEQAVATRQPGDGPGDRADPTRQQHVLRFKVKAETMALFRDLQAAVRADLGGHVDDDALLFEIARRALAGPADLGRASYQVAVARCDNCLQVSVEAGGQRHVVEPAVAGVVNCDAQEIGRVDRTAAGNAALDASIASEARVASSEPGGSPADLDTPTSPHVGAAAASALLPRIRATQSVPPATRRLVMRRDRSCCAVPGCTNHIFVDVHHIRPRAAGGSHAPENLIVLCGAHHRAVHAGHLTIEASGGGSPSFSHADGTPYGGKLTPTADLAPQVLAAGPASRPPTAVPHHGQVADEVLQYRWADGSARALHRAVAARTAAERQDVGAAGVAGQA